jgi:hypothetical protein
VDRQGRLKPSQVAILCPHDKARSSLAQLDTIGRVPLTTDPTKWHQGEDMLFAAIRSFKGLEADAVLMVDVVAPGPQMTMSTRATKSSSV